MQSRQTEPRGEIVTCRREDFALLSRAILGSGKGFRFKALGWSMSPNINDGDVITLSPIPASAAEVGDVLLYINFLGAVVVHRLVAKLYRGAEMTLVIRGDAFPDSTAFVLPDQVLGKVSSIQRKRGPGRGWKMVGRRLVRKMLRAFRLPIYLPSSVDGRDE